MVPQPTFALHQTNELVLHSGKVSIWFVCVASGTVNAVPSCSESQESVPHH